MPKMKPKKSVLKRMRLTKNGKVVRYRSGTEKFLAHKSAKRRRRLRGHRTLGGEWAKNMRVLLTV